MPRQPLLFAYWLLKHPVFLFTPPYSQTTYNYLRLTVLSTQPIHSQLDHLWLSTLHCAFHPAFTQPVRPPMITYPSLCFPPNPYTVS